MICAGCHTFPGNPCACCRTIGRLRFLVERGNLPVFKEQEVLNTLRNAAGAISDLVEFCGFKPRAQANDPVAALQHAQPNLRGHLQGSWRLLKSWAVNEIPNRAPPIPEQVLQAMAGWASFNGHNTFGVSLAVGFYSMLRSGELLSAFVLPMFWCLKKRDKLSFPLDLLKGANAKAQPKLLFLLFLLLLLLLVWWNDGKRLLPLQLPWLPPQLCGKASSANVWRPWGYLCLDFDHTPSEREEQRGCFQNIKIWTVSLSKGGGWPKRLQGYIKMKAWQCWPAPTLILSIQISNLFCKFTTTLSKSQVFKHCSIRLKPKGRGDVEWRRNKRQGGVFKKCAFSCALG